MSSDATVNALRDALQLSPENVPLRQHLAETLLSLGRAEEAGKEFRLGLQQSPTNTSLKVGLASAFAHQDKNSEALVIIEDLVKSPDAPAKAHVLYARLLLKTGEIDAAVRQ